VRDDPVVSEGDAHVGENLFDRTDVLDRVDLKRQVMQARRLGGEGGVALLPQCQLQIATGAEERVAVGPIKARLELLEAQRPTLEVDRTPQLGDVETDVAGGDSRCSADGHRFLQGLTVVLAIVG
jgi:hypothetical protein